MGELPETVYVIGCPSLDVVADAAGSIAFENLKKGVGDDFDPEEPYLVVSQHPVTTEHDESYTQITSTLEAMKNLAREKNLQIVWLWPNIDSGSDKIAKRLREFRETDGSGRFHFYRNFSPEDYVRLLRGALCLIGNSSSGIREASYLGLPVVNIGTRQAGRERAPNVLDVDYSAPEIAGAVREQIRQGRYPQSKLYGNGDAGERMAEIISVVPLSVQKKFHES
jgi:UDP-hydrolysing UDP-N-acetyl-D-glucosamine 2-epimerase